MKVLATQMCLTLCDPMDCPTLCDPIEGSPPGSSIPGILQARTLEWVAMSFSAACLDLDKNDILLKSSLH